MSYGVRAFIGLTQGKTGRFLHKKAESGAHGERSARLSFWEEDIREETRKNREFSDEKILRFYQTKSSDGLEAEEI